MKMVNSNSLAGFRLNAIPIKIAAGFLEETDKLILGNSRDPQ